VRQWYNQIVTPPPPFSFFPAAPGPAVRGFLILISPPFFSPVDKKFSPPRPKKFLQRVFLPFPSRPQSVMRNTAMHSPRHGSSPPSPRRRCASQRSSSADAFPLTHYARRIQVLCFLFPHLPPSSPVTPLAVILVAFFSLPVLVVTLPP